MKLNYFTEKTVPKTSARGSRQLARIAFGKKGAVAINQTALQLLGIGPGDKVSIAQDEEDPINWYLFVDKKEGFTLRPHSDGKTCVFNHSALCSMIREALELSPDKTHTFLIAGEPTVIDKVKYYGILIG